MRWGDPPSKKEARELPGVIAVGAGQKGFPRARGNWMQRALQASRFPFILGINKGELPTPGGSPFL